MKQLTGLDSAFLSAETANWPTHVASLTIFDPSKSQEPYTVDRLKELIAARLHLLPPLRWRLAEPPLSLGPPYWLEDPDFDLDYHVRRIAVPSPGDRRELAELAAEIYRRHLDRRRPLWEWWVIEGLEGGHIACLFKIHHAYLDGVTGVAMHEILFDETPEPKVVAPPPGYRWKPDTIPSNRRLLVQSLPFFLGTPVRLGRQLRSLGDAARNLGRESGRMRTQAPETSFNAPISQHRSFAYASVSLSDVKRVKNAFGVKVNDVVLAICAGALRRYLSERRELPEDPLIASVPVNIRSSDQAGHGNQISGMTASLATDVADPVERLRQIHDSTQASKEIHDAMGAKTLMGLADTPPPMLVWLAIQFYARSQLSRRFRVPYNLVISNVPGPPHPMYHMGAEVKGVYSMGICFDGAGLYVGLMSHADQIDFGLLACKELVPDPWFISDGISAALDELVSAARP